MEFVIIAQLLSASNATKKKEVWIEIMFVLSIVSPARIGLVVVDRQAEEIQLFLFFPEIFLCVGINLVDVLQTKATLCIAYTVFLKRVTPKGFETSMTANSYLKF